MKCTQPDRNYSPFPNNSQAAANAEGGRDQSTEPIGLLTVQGRAKGGQDTPSPQLSKGKQHSGSNGPPLSPIFLSNQQSLRGSPMVTRE